MENNTSANIVRDILQLFKKESLDTTAKSYITKLLLIYSRLSRYAYWTLIHVDQFNVLKLICLESWIITITALILTTKNPVPHLQRLKK